jgi:hypothetical protein
LLGWGRRDLGLANVVHPNGEPELIGQGVEQSSQIGFGPGDSMKDGGCPIEEHFRIQEHDRYTRLCGPSVSGSEQFFHQAGEFIKF